MFYIFKRISETSKFFDIYLWKSFLWVFSSTISMVGAGFTNGGSRTARFGRRGIVQLNLFEWINLLINCTVCCILYAVNIFLNSYLPFLKFFLPFSVFVFLFDKVTIFDSDAMRTAGYNHLISRNYNINYFRLPDSAKLKTTISYWLVCPTNWSTGHFWIMLNYRSVNWYSSTVRSIFVPLFAATSRRL